MKEHLNGYVVRVVERLQDGEEVYASYVPNLEAALAGINDPRFAKDNCSFKVFELGEEVHLETFEEREKQPDKVVTKFKVKQ